MHSDNTYYDKALAVLKNNRLIVGLIIIFILVTGLATFTDSISKLRRSLFGEPIPQTDNASQGQLDSARTAQSAVTSKTAAVDSPSSTSASYDLATVRIVGTEANSIASLRASHGLRELTQFESGKPLSDIPAGTYFFIQTSSLQWRSDESFEAVAQRIATRRFYDPILKSIFFEGHKVSPSHVYLLAYTTKETASRIATLDGNTEKRCTAYVGSKMGFDSLVYLPLFRAVESKQRGFDFDDQSSGYVLELTLK